MSDESKMSEILSEFLGTMLMVGWGLGAVVVFWSSASPLPAMIENESLRRLLTGFFFASGAAVVVYSPLGERSGGHINPSVTLAFLSLKKILPLDALYYVIAQVLGGLFGSYIIYLLFNVVLGWQDAILKCVTTAGSGYSAELSFMAEIFITFLLMMVILVVSNNRTWMKLTALLASTLVMLEVWLEAPISGTSLNVARSFGPAYITSVWDNFWIYLFAPILGALIAAQFYRLSTAGKKIICSKLYHTKKFKCKMPGCSFNSPTQGEE